MIISLFLSLIVCSNILLSHCCNKTRCGLMAFTNQEKYFIVVKDDCYRPLRKLSQVKVRQNRKVYKRASNELMLFRILSGSRQESLSYFRNGGDESSPVLDGNGNFRSVLLNEWSYIKPLSMNITLGDDNGCVIAWLQFKVRERDSMESWFRKENLVASYPWKVSLLLQSDYNFFRIAGTQTSIDRSFYMNTHWAGCPNDLGVLAIFDSMSEECDYAKYYKGIPLVFPQVMFAEKNGHVGNWTLDRRLARSMEILGKYDPDIEIYS